MYKTVYILLCGKKSAQLNRMTKIHSYLNLLMIVSIIYKEEYWQQLNLSFRWKNKNQSIFTSESKSPTALGNSTFKTSSESRKSVKDQHPTSQHMNQLSFLTNKISTITKSHPMRKQNHYKIESYEVA